MKTDTKTKIKVDWQQFNMLQDVITTFSEDPKNYRSVNGNGACRYIPPKEKPLSAGCAISIYLDNKTAKKLDRDNYSIDSIIWGYNNLKKLLPKWMINMNTTFLTNIQELHDMNIYWTEDNISKEGKTKVKGICRDYNLPFEMIEFKP